VLTIGTFVYLACLPLGWYSYREYERKDALVAASHASPAMQAEPPSPPQLPSDDTERPARLN
jgi:hypothetical protein